MSDAAPIAGPGGGAGPDAGLRLFVLGQTETMRRAILNARRLGPVDVVDVRDNPAAAESARVLATPTLMRTDDPRVRIVGDLRDLVAVRGHLGPPYDEPAGASGTGHGDG